jgi:hypothetical protein
MTMTIHIIDPRHPGAAIEGVWFDLGQRDHFLDKKRAIGLPSIS